MSVFSKVTILLCACVNSHISGFCQTVQAENVKCTYLATSQISDDIKNMEDIHIREMVIKKLQEDKKTYEMSYSNDVYYFSLASNVVDNDIKNVGQANGYYMDFNSDSIYVQRQILDKTFLIKDTINRHSWVISDEKKAINGKECQKAVTSVGRYNVTAWFSIEDAIPFGPLGYFGLPGLIVELETPTYIYTLQSIVFPKETTIFNKPTEGRVVSQKEFDQLEIENMKSRGNITPGSVKVIRIGK